MMSRTLFAGLFVLQFLLTFSLPSFALDVPAELKEVAGIKHPLGNVYATGQPSSEAFTVFTKAGVTHVINLRPAKETPDSNEREVVTQAGMRYDNIPIASGSDLTRDNVKKLDAMLNASGNEVVLLHCSSGNRVGAMMALRAAWIQHVPVAEALKIGESYGLTKLLPEVRGILSDPLNTQQE